MTFVFIPMISANVYNLFYTWPGRQVFWIDIECLIMTTAILICHCIVILKSEKEYLKDMLGLEDNIAFQQDPHFGNRRRKLPIDNETRDLASQVVASGIDDERRLKIKEMTQY